MDTTTPVAPAAPAQAAPAVAIDEEQVPLAVVDADEEMDVTDILDPDTPLAITDDLPGRVWWYWILIIISTISAFVGGNKSRKEAKAEEKLDK